MRLRLPSCAVACLILATACEGDGCGGGTCPFAVGGYAVVRGALGPGDRAPASPVGPFAVAVACPGASAVVTTAAGAEAYEVALETRARLPRDTATLACVVSAGASGRPFAVAETTGVAFGRARERRPTTVVDLRLPAAP